MGSRIHIIIGLGICFLLIRCVDSRPSKLPYIGQHAITDSDTLYYQVPNFEFVNQDSILINTKALSDKVYIADFFYTYCPTICPKVKSQMLRIYEKYEKEDRLNFVSFALDPKRDNVDRLSMYAKNIEVSSKRWHFLTGNKDTIWDLAESFLISVREDPDEPGGIYHTGKILLIDQDSHIRSFVDGTNKDKVDQFMKDIDQLLSQSQ